MSIVEPRGQRSEVVVCCLCFALDLMLDAVFLCVVGNIVDGCLTIENNYS